MPIKNICTWINVKKTKAMTTNFNIKIISDEVEMVKTMKYFCVLIDKKLNFKNTCIR